MGEVYVRDGGSWQQIPNGTALSVKDGGSWVNPTEVFVRDGGTWQSVWLKSDPVTVNTNVTTVNTFRRNLSNNQMGWLNDGYATIGRFSSDYDRVGVYKCDNALYGLAMGARQTVTAASITLKRDASGGSSSLTGNVYMGLYTGTVGSGTPSYSTELDFTPNASKSLSSVGYNDVITFDLGTTFGQTVNDVISAFNTVQLAFSVRTSGWDATGTDSLYSRWRGPTTGYTGVLSITCDY